MNMITYNLTKTPIYSWCPTIEEVAKQQMEIIANLPYVVHCALMPDEIKKV
jgi:hypothetical protein